VVERIYNNNNNPHNMFTVIMKIKSNNQQLNFHNKCFTNLKNMFNVHSFRVPIVTTPDIFAFAIFKTLGMKYQSKK